MRRRFPPALRVLASVLALACLLFASACGGGEGPPQPIRLLDLPASGEMTAEWPEGALAMAAEALVAAEIGATPAPGRVARVIMEPADLGGDARVSLLAPAGSRYLVPLTLPRGEPALEVGLGVPKDGAAEGALLRFRVVLTPLESASAEAVELLDERVTTAAGGGWTDRTIPLARWAGERVRLELLVEGVEGVEGAAAAPLAWGAWGAPEIVFREQSGPEDWNVLLVVLDTLRADRLGAAGYRRPTSPYLDALAGRSIRFTTAVSQSSWTRPSIRSLLQGLYPESQGGLQSPMLAEVLWANGYRTEAITGGAQLAYPFGFSRGFERHAIEDWVRATDRVVETLASNAGRKNFLFLHTYEIHDPYEHRELAGGLDPGRVGEAFRRATWEGLKDELTDGEKEYVSALYDSGIRFTDERLGRLLARLDERGLLDRTLVIVTSDHGEELWDNGLWGHGRAMLEHQSRVPLIVHVPQAMRDALALREPGVVRQQVRLVDLYPTILDLLGVGLDHQVQGRSLRPLLAGERLPRAAAFSESVYWGPVEVKALRGERYKYLRGIPKNPADTRHEGWEVLYDLKLDPQEMVDVQERAEEVLRRMRQEVDRILAGGAAPRDERVPSDLDPEVEKQLRALGYID